MHVSHFDKCGAPQRTSGGNAAIQVNTDRSVVMCATNLACSDSTYRGKYKVGL